MSTIEGSEVGAERGERFVSWGGRIGGAVGLAGLAAVVAASLFGEGGGFSPAAYAVCGLVALVLWVVMLRPLVAVEGDRLVLRNPLSTVRVPLAAIEKVVVRQFLVIRADGRSFSSAAVGRSRRQNLRDDRRGGTTGIDVAKLSYAAHVERRLGRLTEDARMLRGVDLYSDEQQALARDVRREPAWVELGLFAALGLALAVALLV